MNTVGHRQPQTLLALYGESVERLRAAMLANAKADFQAALAVLQEQRSEDFSNELRALADALHDAMVQFRRDFSIAAVGGRDSSDAGVKLQYVLHLTNQAAHRTIDLVEQCVPLLDRTVSTAGELTAESAELPPKVSEFITATWQDCTLVRGKLSQLVLEQSYQDLSGQIIRGVVVLVDQVELVLAKILGLTGTSGRTAAYRIYRPEAPALDQQSDVDDLMADLGI
jgi:chemotaxis protein CheZ